MLPPAAGRQVDAPDSPRAPVPVAGGEGKGAGEHHLEHRIPDLGALAVLQQMTVKKIV